MAEKKKTFYRRVLPDVCTAFASEKGKQLFIDALATGHMNCYFPLASQFRTQEEPAYCGLSSLVMVLNALAVDPGVVWKGVFRWYHEDMLDCCTPLEEVKVHGVSMDQLMCLALCNQLDGELKRVDETACIAQFRKEVKFATTREDQAIIVSYGRGVLGQTGTGHFSPIGGYNALEDMVLIMDVARFKYPPYWVSMTDLWKAMNTLDLGTGNHRGYMLLWRADTRGMPNQPPLIFKVSQKLNASQSFFKESGSFLLKMKTFLNGKAEDNSDDKILKHILDTFLEESCKYKTEGSDGEELQSFLTVRVTQSQLVTQFPEQAEAVQQLVQAIYETSLCQKIAKIYPKGICCEQALFNAKGTTSNDECVICLQHFLTIFILSFPMDGVTTCHNCKGETVGGNKSHEKTYADSGTYYAFLRKVIDAEMDIDRCVSLGSENSLEKQRHGLLINEVTQLRRQFFVLMDGCRA